MANEFYRDLVGVIAPRMAELFSAILKNARALGSLAAPEIVSMPKVAVPRSGQECRPIALLNDDYKVLFRVLAS